MILALAIGLAPAAAMAQKQAALSVKAGETMTLTIDDGGRLVPSKKARAPALNAFEAAAVRQLTNGDYNFASGPNSAPIKSGNGMPEAEPVESGIVRVTLRRLPAKDMLLIVENGYGRGLKYKAILREGGRSTPTDVCEVMPETGGFEHWPNSFDAIELAEIRFLVWTEGQEPVCE